MTSAKKKGKDTNLQVVEEALSRSERFIEGNSKILTIAVIGVVVLVGIWLGYKRFIVAPAEREAQSQMFVAEQYFEQDSFNLALNGDGNYLGFLDIIDEYRSTKSANLSRYYAGISYLQLGQFEDAIDYLKKFKSKDELVYPMSLGATGDAYAELEEIDKAVEYYLEAARCRDNSLTTPLFLFKAATIQESQGEIEKALKNYREILEKYPNSAEGRTIEKYIARAEAHVE